MSDSNRQRNQQQRGPQSEPQREQPQQQSVRQPPTQQGVQGAEKQAAKLGLFSYGIVTLGVLFGNVLGNLIGGGESVYFGGGFSGLLTMGEDTSEFVDTMLSEFGALYLGTADTYRLFLPLSAVIAVGLGFYYYKRSSEITSPIKLTAIATATGVFTVGIVLILLMLLFEPSEVEIEGEVLLEETELVELNTELPLLIGFAIGNVIIGVITTKLLENDSIDIP